MSDSPLPHDEIDRRVQLLRAQQEEWLKQYGFYTHSIFPRADAPDEVAFNHHTHGLFDTQGHLDLQIRLSIPGNVAQGIFHKIVDEIKTGKKFVAGEDYEGILANGYKCRMVLRRESGRPVLRVVIPPENGELDREKMHDAFYEAQYDTKGDQV